jgi:DNA-directed RNA polymerase specialized sigma24 family protein
VDDRIGALILYAYTLGGNTREIARLTGLDHDEVATALARAAHLDALAKAGITEAEWRSSCV